MTTLKTIVFALALISIAACRTQAPEPSGESAIEVAAASEEISDASVYALSAEWTNQDGTALRLTNLRGKPVMMAMVFTNCRYACPIIVHDMKRIEREMPDDLSSDLQFVLVSLDPERDDPEALARFAKVYGLDSDRWTLLQGTATDVRMLAAVLGVKYKRQADGQYSHTNMVAVLDDGGEILHREMNPGGEPSSMIAALRRSAGPSAL